MVEILTIPPEVLVKHVTALGGSGSGKTFACTSVLENARVPCVVIEGQGDLVTLADSPRLRRRYHPLIFTPLSNLGIPIRIDPLFGLYKRTRKMDEFGRLLGIEHASRTCLEFLGFDPDKNRPMLSFMNTAILGGKLHSLKEMTSFEFMSGIPRHYSWRHDYVQACLAMNNTVKGAMLSGKGWALDTTKLLGRDEHGLPYLSIFYIKHIRDERLRQFIVGSVMQSTFITACAMSGTGLKALDYIDEFSPYMPPPPRNPQAKASLSVIRKEGRKYGLASIFSSQNPGDIDYKALSNSGTWLIGRFSTGQDIGKLKAALKAGDPDIAKAIISRLPSLKPGDMVMYSPDLHKNPVVARAPPLLHKHGEASDSKAEEIIQRTMIDERKLWRSMTTD